MKYRRKEGSADAAQFTGENITFMLRFAEAVEAIVTYNHEGLCILQMILKDRTMYKMKPESYFVKEFDNCKVIDSDEFEQLFEKV